MSFVTSVAGRQDESMPFEYFTPVGPPAAAQYPAALALDVLHERIVCSTLWAWKSGAYVGVGVHSVADSQLRSEFSGLFFEIAP